MARIGDDRILDQESRLLLYLASLAEVSQMATEDRFAFVLPSSNVWGHLLRKLKIVRNSARQPHLRGKVGDLLETNLKVLSTHNNPCLSGLSRAILYQLYPTTWLNATASFLEDIGNNQSTGPNYSSQYAKLAEIRMLRAQVMDAYRIFGTIEPSIGRYIYRYCVVILDQCKFDDSSSKEGIFEATLDLAHLIMIVRGSHAVPLASGGDSILEKAAVCLKELKSILDRDNGGGMVSGSETKLLVLLANSLVIAVERYLSSLLTKSKRRDPLGRHAGVYGSSTIPGVKLLEGALLQTLRQGKCHFAIDKVARIITILYSVDMTPTNPPFHLDGTYDVTALMAQLSTRAHSTVNAASDRVPAIRALLRILNNMPTELAWYTALAPAQKGHPTISEIIVDIARDESLECRSAAFSAILETHIFRPSRENFNRYAKPANQPPEDSNGNFATQEIRLMVRQAENSYFQRFYEDLLEDPSPLLQAIEGTELDKVLTYKAISIISLLVQLSPPDFSPKFLVNNQLFRAVASVASHEDTTLVPISTRTLAIQLFAWLWRGIDQRQTLQQGEQSTDYTEVFNPNPLLAELTKGIAIVVDVHASIELECVSILVERLEIIFASLGDIQTLAQRELIDGLAEAVLWADLGKPVEDDREKLLSRLDALKIMDPVVSNSQLQLTLGEGRDTCSHELYK
ncbi:hypothetical protein FRC02_000321 [Tulasnella sp. 418]|nr:hypothetical protein FRC02_000321 [Tulasnella sp. 418]